MDNTTPFNSMSHAYIVRPRSYPRNRRPYATIGLFGDIHFQDKGLDRINRTAKWIIDEFKARKVDAVVCLGDVLNTREQVSVKALSSALNFFDTMASTLNKSIHIILGNHDQPLKYSSKISSLDMFSMGPMTKAGFHVYRKTTVTSVAGIPALMIPYHEDDTIIAQEIKYWLEKYGEDSLKSTVAFGHLSINGAIQNASNTTYKGFLMPEVFAPLKRTFSGHFHTHHSHPYNITYVGAPLQFNFGDAGCQRGICIYDTDTDTVEYIVNPHHKQFVKVNYQEVDALLKESPDAVKDTFVLVQYTTEKLAPQFHEEIKRKLHRAGAQAVFKENLITQILKDSAENIARVQKKGIEDQLRAFLNHLKASFARITKKKTEQQSKWESMLTDKNKLEALIQKGLQIVRSAQVSNIDATEGKVFDAKLAKLVITNFMGVQGTIVIPFSEMRNGIWMIEGQNGAGKSTILEALVWAHFGDFLRSGMMKDFAINDNCKECTVRVEYANGFVIERTRKRARGESLKTFRKRPDGTEVYIDDMELGELRNSQKLLNQTIGIDYDTFSRSIVLGQNIFSNFISGSKEQRRDIIEEMLGLDKFNVYLQAAKDERVELEKRLFALSSARESALQEISRLQSEIDSLRVQLTKRQEAGVGAEERKANLMDEKEKALAQLRKRQSEISKALEKARMELKQLEEKIASFNFDAARDTISELSMKEKHLTSLSRNKSDCPSCGQPISPEHVTKTVTEARTALVKAVDLFPVLSRFSSSIPQIGDEVEPQVLTKLLSVSAEVRRALETEISQCTRSSATMQSNVKELEVQLIRVENDILRSERSFDAALQSIDKDAAALEAELSVLTSHIESRTADIQLLNEKVVATENEMKEVTMKYDIARFWELAFEKQSKSNTGIFTVRSYIFEDLVAELNAIIETYMDQLSTAGHKLSVTLTPDLDLTETYAKRSGGERKRTDLAVLFALYEIVRDRSRYHPNFIMLDEVFDALDKSGRAMVGQVLTALSKRVENIFVITHTDLATGLSIAGTVTVTMKEDLESGAPKGVAIEINSV